MPEVLAHLDLERGLQHLLRQPGQQPTRTSQGQALRLGRGHQLPSQILRQLPDRSQLILDALRSHVIFSSPRPEAVEVTPDHSHKVPDRPVHASWLNQVEIYFSVVQRKLITPDDFADTDELARQITVFEKRYNQAARPFDWRFSRNDLNHLLDRLAA